MKLNPTPVSQTTEVMQYPNMNPVVSTYGSSTGIVWGIQSTGFLTGSPEVLHAYDAGNLANQLFNSSILAANQVDGSPIRFAVPTIANNNVYLGTGDALDIYGLQDSSSANQDTPSGSNVSWLTPSEFQALLNDMFETFKSSPELFNPAFIALLRSPQVIQTDLHANLPYVGRSGQLGEDFVSGDFVTTSSPDDATLVDSSMSPGEEMMADVMT